MPHEDALVRLGSAIGKYWICKRTPGHAYEAMECLGGSGVMEDSPMPRLYREAPVNAIWEGSGNVQCLDIARAIQRSPQTLEAYFAEVSSVKGESAALDAHVAALKDDLRELGDFEAHARDLCDRLAVGLAGGGALSAPARRSPRLSAARASRRRGAHNYGALTRRGREGDREARRAAVDPHPSRLSIARRETGVLPNALRRERGSALMQGPSRSRDQIRTARRWR